MSSDVDRDLENLYLHAKERLERIRAAWEVEGEPLTTHGSMNQLVEHPIAKQIRDGERHVAMLARSLERKGVGRPPVAVIKTGIGESPAAKRRLKVAK